MARIRWCLILLVLASFAPRAWAACTQTSATERTCTDEGEAFAACIANAEAIGPSLCAVTPVRPYVSATCAKGTPPYDNNTYGPFITCQTDTQPRTGTASLNKFFRWSATCSSRADEYGWSPPGGVAGGNVCSQGCTYTYVLDASGNFFSPTGSVCTTTDAPEPVIDTDGDGVPDEDDAFPNDPNESSDSDGDGIGDNADFSPNDPTDGSDTPGEEDGDDEGDNTASGGGDCKAPPSCKGDGIQCNQLFQQWQIRCSGATVTGDPTNCSSGYSCSGDSVQCATVALLRKTACATGDDGGTGGSPGDANGNGVPDVLEGSGAGDTGDPGESDNVTRFGIGVDASLLDQENIFGGGSCPTPPSLTIMGKTVSGADFPYWCQAMAILRALILIFGAFTAVKILTGWGFS